MGEFAIFGIILDGAQSGDLVLVEVLHLGVVSFGVLVSELLVSERMQIVGTERGKR